MISELVQHAISEYNGFSVEKKISYKENLINRLNKLNSLEEKTEKISKLIQDINDFLEEIS